MTTANNIHYDPEYWRKRLVSLRNQIKASLNSRYGEYNIRWNTRLDKIDKRDRDFVQFGIQLQTIINNALSVNDVIQFRRAGPKVQGYNEETEIKKFMEFWNEIENLYIVFALNS